MKKLNMFLMVSGLVIFSSSYAMNKRVGTPWKIDYDKRDPKLCAQQLSHPVKDPNTRINGILLNSVYGSTAINPDTALDWFKTAIDMAEQSKRIGRPVSVGVLYNLLLAQREATQIIFDRLEESGDRTKLLLSPEQWRKIGSDTPLIINLLFLGVEAGLEKTVEQKIGHLAVEIAQGALAGGGIGAVLSLAKNGSDNVLRETKNVLWKEKVTIVKEVTTKGVKVITENAMNAIDKGLDFATAELNNRDVDKVGPHCEYGIFYESETFFVDVVKGAASALQGELLSAGIDYGIELAIKFGPTALRNSRKGSIKFGDVLDGAVVGGAIGLLDGVRTIDRPIQTALLHHIYCRRA